MIRKEYHIHGLKSEDAEMESPKEVRNEIIRLLNTSFQKGAVVEIKIMEGIDVSESGKRFSRLRLDIISNTDFDDYC